MNIGVIGLGALGMLVASKLSVNHAVTGYVRRPEQIERIKQSGLISDVNIYNVSTKLINDIGHHELYIVCVKQTHLNDVIPYLKKLLDDDKVIFLQNGLGHVEKVQSLKPKVFLGTCDHGVMRLSDYEYSHKGEGKVRIASLRESNRNDAVRLVEALDYSFFPVEIHPELFRILYEKLMINSVINPLTAIFEVPNGQVVENTYLNKLAKKLTKEGADALSLDFDRLWEKVKEVAIHTKDNHSSMLRDIEQRQLTEIDYINGYIMKVSDQPVPYHECMYNMVKAKEQR
ncbi:ketopantoate reductase family protein [Tenuibacillus multivorans]|uniref:2-dehydropantoate 2-reductase n=1 Tax=Tenuibacillus multivorans TaxID=237069 RepID=A0A1G9Y8N5_9BACI|nr:2-dehydropantoate 2-reductase [Tenuibacillus multivorans]GEL75978.1 putative 2-dehydropantoate 2-reductase [Tenuibacillus multivorans]SDN05016.1 2-dehydropantoate 2-reductase [Tenuibacillus multivorans]